MTEAQQIQQLINVSSEQVPAELCQDLADLSLEEAISYAFALLEEYGVDDPYSFLQAKGILD